MGACCSISNAVAAEQTAPASRVTGTRADELRSPASLASLLSSSDSSSSGSYSRSKSSCSSVSSVAHQDDAGGARELIPAAALTAMHQAAAKTADRLLPLLRGFLDACDGYFSAQQERVLASEATTQQSPRPHDTPGAGARVLRAHADLLHGLAEHRSAAGRGPPGLLGLLDSLAAVLEACTAAPPDWQGHVPLFVPAYVLAQARLVCVSGFTLLTLWKMPLVNSSEDTCPYAASPARSSNESLPRLSAGSVPHELLRCLAKCSSRTTFHNLKVADWCSACMTKGALSACLDSANEAHSAGLELMESTLKLRLLAAQEAFLVSYSVATACDCNTVPEASATSGDAPAQTTPAQQGLFSASLPRSSVSQSTDDEDPLKSTGLQTAIDSLLTAEDTVDGFWLHDELKEFADAEVEAVLRTIAAQQIDSDHVVDIEWLREEFWNDHLLSAWSAHEENVHALLRWELCAAWARDRLGPAALAIAKSSAPSACAATIPDMLPTLRILLLASEASERLDPKTPQIAVPVIPDLQQAMRRAQLTIPRGVSIAAAVNAVNVAKCTSRMHALRWPGYAADGVPIAALAHMVPRHKCLQESLWLIAGAQQPSISTPGGEDQLGEISAKLEGMSMRGWLSSAGMLSTAIRRIMSNSALLKSMTRRSSTLDDETKGHSDEARDVAAIMSQVVSRFDNALRALMHEVAPEDIPNAAGPPQTPQQQQQHEATRPASGRTNRSSTEANDVWASLQDGLSADTDAYGAMTIQQLGACIQGRLSEPFHSNDGSVHTICRLSRASLPAYVMHKRASTHAASPGGDLPTSAARTSVPVLNSSKQASSQGALNGTPRQHHSPEGNSQQLAWTGHGSSSTEDKQATPTSSQDREHDVLKENDRSDPAANQECVLKAAVSARHDIKSEQVHPTTKQLTHARSGAASPCLEPRGSWVRWVEPQPSFATSFATHIHCENHGIAPIGVCGQGHGLDAYGSAEEHGRPTRSQLQSAFADESESSPEPQHAVPSSSSSESEEEPSKIPSPPRQGDVGEDDPTCEAQEPRATSLVRADSSFGAGCSRKAGAVADTIFSGAEQAGDVDAAIADILEEAACSNQRMVGMLRVAYHAGVLPLQRLCEVASEAEAVGLTERKAWFTTLFDYILEDSKASSTSPSSGCLSALSFSAANAAIARRILRFASYRHAHQLSPLRCELLAYAVGAQDAETGVALHYLRALGLVSANKGGYALAAGAASLVSPMATQAEDVVHCDACSLRLAALYARQAVTLHYTDVMTSMYCARNAAEQLKWFKPDSLTKMAAVDLAHIRGVLAASNVFPLVAPYFWTTFEHSAHYFAMDSTLRVSQVGTSAADNDSEQCMESIWSLLNDITLALGKHLASGPRISMSGEGTDGGAELESNQGSQNRALDCALVTWASLSLVSVNFDTCRHAGSTANDGVSQALLDHVKTTLHKQLDIDSPGHPATGDQAPARRSQSSQQGHGDAGAHESDSDDDSDGDSHTLRSMSTGVRESSEPLLPLRPTPPPVLVRHSAEQGQPSRAKGRRASERVTMAPPVALTQLCQEHDSLASLETLAQQWAQALRGTGPLVLATFVGMADLERRRRVDWHVAYVTVRAVALTLDNAERHLCTSMSKDNPLYRSTSFRDSSESVSARPKHAHEDNSLTDVPLTTAWPAWATRTRSLICASQLLLDAPRGLAAMTTWSATEAQSMAIKHASSAVSMLHAAVDAGQISFHHTLASSAHLQLGMAQVRSAWPCRPPRPPFKPHQPSKKHHGTKRRPHAASLASLQSTDLVEVSPTARKRRLALFQGQSFKPSHALATLLSLGSSAWREPGHVLGQPVDSDTEESASHVGMHHSRFKAGTGPARGLATSAAGDDLLNTCLSLNALWSCGGEAHVGNQASSMPNVSLLAGTAHTSLAGNAFTTSASASLVDGDQAGPASVLALKLPTTLALDVAVAEEPVRDVDEASRAALMHADSLLVRSLDLNISLLGAQHPQSVALRDGLAAMLQGVCDASVRNQSSSMMRLLLDLLQQRMALLGWDSPCMVDAVVVTAWTLLARQDRSMQSMEVLQSVLEAALDVARVCFGPTSMEASRVLLVLRAALQSMGKADDDAVLAEVFWEEYLVASQLKSRPVRTQMPGAGGRKADTGADWGEEEVDPGTRACDEVEDAQPGVLPIASLVTTHARSPSDQQQSVKVRKQVKSYDLREQWEILGQLAVSPVAVSKALRKEGSTSQDFDSLLAASPLSGWGEDAAAPGQVLNIKAGDISDEVLLAFRRDLGTSYVPELGCLCVAVSGAGEVHG